MSPVAKHMAVVLLLLGGLLASGCGSSSGNPKSIFNSDTGKHISGWLPAGHKTAAQSDIIECTFCHGTDYQGGTANVSCLSCHLGGVSSVHPQGWLAPFIWGRHASYVSDNGNAACANTYCHGASLTGVDESGPSCSSCHLGGNSSFHPTSWGTTSVGIDTAHASYVATNGNSGCSNAACHGADLTGVSGSGPSCSSCHLGGSGSIHPTDWGTNIDFVHGSFVTANNTTRCANAACHGADLTGVTNSGPSCSSCHLGGATSIHPTDWGSGIDTAHGTYVDTNGNAGCANVSCHGATLSGVANSGPSCSSCHLGGVGSFHPSNWGANTDTLHGSYVDTNGTTACANAACHGASLTGVTNSGPSCSSCHLGGATSIHPTAWGSNVKINHATYDFSTNGTTACANAACHGTVLGGVTNSGPACSSCHVNVSGTGAPSPATGCTSCHASPPSGASDPNVAGAHAPHNALTNVTGVCNTCHNGAGSGTTSHDNGTKDVLILTTYNAKTGTAMRNSDGTCSSVSCHGGQKTPVWLSGTIDVNTQCTSCHVYGTSQYNSFYSGQHDFHVNSQLIGCTECHDTSKLVVNHFTTLNTPALEGPASATLLNSINYDGTTCSPACHDQYTW